MKKIIKQILSLLVIVNFTACSDNDNTINEILDIESGAVLRTLDVISNTLDSSVPSSEFSVSLEEQDREDGALFKQINLFVSKRDLTTQNDSVGVGKTFIKSIPASAFTNGPLNLPRGIVSATFTEAITAMNLPASDYTYGKDIYIFDFELELTDGRKFDATNAGRSIEGGFFASPFRYNTTTTCPPAAGDYIIEMEDKAGDGWQTERGIIVSFINGSGDDEVVVETDVLLETGASGTFTLTVPNGTEKIKWEYTKDFNLSDVSFKITAPNGDLIGDFLAPLQGELDIALLCD